MDFVMTNLIRDLNMLVYGPVSKNTPSVLPTVNPIFSIEYKDKKQSKESVCNSVYISLQMSHLIMISLLLVDMHILLP